MNINQLAKEVHDNAVAHGWWDKPPTLPEALCLIHAELSEALEEYRNGAPLVYGTCALAEEDCQYFAICDRVGQPGAEGADGPCKPEGIAVEETVLTITRVKRSYSPWSSKIYTLRETPKK